MAYLPVPASERLAHFTELLQEEEREARARNAALAEGKSDRLLEQDGVLARGVRLEDEGRALLGRSRVTFAEDPQRRGHLELFAARPGAVVTVRPRGEDKGQGRSGVLVYRRAGRLTVVFDEPLEQELGAALDVLLAFDEVSLRRMREGLARCENADGHSLSLLEVVLGLKPPRPTRPGAYRPLDEALNEDQLAAAVHGVYADDVGLIHGPPGTGKTRVLVEVVRQCAARGERVLCLTASNAAVDHLAISLLERDPELPLARAGHPARVHPALEAHTFAGLTEAHELRQLARRLVDDAFRLLRGARRRSDSFKEARAREKEAKAEAGKLFADARRLERQAVEAVLERTRVVCGTLTGYERELPSDARFDVLVVDEASQAVTPALLLGLPRAGRVVLAGDHRQLPPTVVSLAAERGGLARTAFDELRGGPEAAGYSHMLTVQHRMHTALMAFPSARFYDERLRAHGSVASHTLADLSIVDGPLTALARPLDVIDTAGAGHEERRPEGSASRDNPGEAALVAEVVKGLVEGGLPAADIGVVTPYAAQAALLGGELAVFVDQGLEVDSVDGFQGREKEAIVLSCVRSNGLGEVGFVGDARRLNVAITRARRKLVVVGDSATLGSDELWSAFFEHAIAAGAYRSCFEL